MIRYIGTILEALLPENKPEVLQQLQEILMTSRCGPENEKKPFSTTRYGLVAYQKANANIEQLYRKQLVL
jgi:hypothetical protein